MVLSVCAPSSRIMFILQHVSPVGRNFPALSAMKDHLANSCLERIVSCRQAGNGCAWKGRMVSLETHVDKCPYESIKGFFAIHSTQMAQLSKENERLRRRTDELEGKIRILRQELEWAKLALGPWYRPVYPERPPMSANCTQCPDDEGASAEPGLSQVGPVLLQDVDPTGGTSLPEPRVENGATEVFDFFDPFSFISQRQDRVSSIYATSNAPTTASATNTDTNNNSSSNANGTRLNCTALTISMETRPSGLVLLDLDLRMVQGPFGTPLWPHYHPGRAIRNRCLPHPPSPCTPPDTSLLKVARLLDTGLATCGVDARFDASEPQPQHTLACKYHHP
jgi:hypothetical protein